MNPVPDELSQILSKEERLHSYSRLYWARTRVYYPKDEDELKLLFAYANQKQGCRVTFRAGGHSFDAQSLGDDLVISMQLFDEIGEVQADNTLTVGAGATWGNILEKAETRGYIPAVTVTTCHASAGGTLAGDCLSRFSPAYGKEGMHVKGFRLVTLDGQAHTCTKPRDGVPESNWTLEERAFRGVISGLGYLGAVTQITHELLPLKPQDQRIAVETRVQKIAGFAALADALVDTTQEMYRQISDPNDPRMHDAVYSALSLPRKGDKEEALVFRSTIKPRPRRLWGRQLLLYKPKAIFRIVVEFMMRRPLLSRLCWWVFYHTVNTDKHYMNKLADYTFFMDGNTRAKKVGAALGFKMRTIQQTFVVPFDPKAENWNAAKDSLKEWITHVRKVFRKHNLEPTLADVLFLPEDELFFMSATTELAGFAASFAFETSNEEKLARIKEAFRELSDDLRTDFKGRVYLVKNVHAHKDTLTTMYGQNALDFFRLKRDLDPHCIFRNEFLDRTFSDLLQCDGRAAAEAAEEERREPTRRFRREEEREPAGEREQ
jgi:decaprenylphospho-beta-D-ribofuranose 2-oxidase